MGRSWTNTEVPRPRASVQRAVLDGEAVLYDVASGRSLLLNSTATQVWLLLDGLTVGELVDALAATHGLDAALLRHDVLLVLDQLAQAGALDRE